MAAEGKKRLLVFCPAFVADCLETLEEIGIRGVEQFRAAGGEALTLVPSLVDMTVVTTTGWLELVSTLVVTLATVDLCWTLLAARAKTFLQNSRTIRRINQISGGMMALAAAAIAVG